jgi:hypothetical protein
LAERTVGSCPGKSSEKGDADVRLDGRPIVDAIGYKTSIRAKSARGSPDEQSDIRVSNDPASRCAHAGYSLFRLAS